MKFSEAYDNFIKALKFRNDIETETFKRYFITTSERLVSFKKKHSDALKELEVYREDNAELKATNAQLKEEIACHLASIINKDNEIKLLGEKINDLQKQNEKQNDELLMASKSILQYKSDLNNQNDTIAAMTTAINEMNREIERLRNLKWYQKLLGKK